MGRHAVNRLLTLGTLTAGVGHEINNPLSYVIANIEFAVRELAQIRADGALPAGLAGRIASCEEALADACHGAERIRVIANDLRSFSHVHEERTEPVDVVAAIDAAVDLAWNELRHRARLARRFAPIPPVSANGQRLVQIFTNILVNAAHAMRRGGVEANELRIAARPEGERVVVEFADTGTGIAPKDLARIFDPFFTTKPPGEGTGLGLSVARELVKAMGGDVRVESVPGEGSVFRVELPASALPLTEAPAGEGARWTPARRVRVLVVDDEPRVLAALRRALLEAHDVVDVTSGRTALALLDAGERFDVVLCDLTLVEGAGGAPFVEALSAARRELAARIVLMTARGLGHEAREIVQRTSGRVLSKPFDTAGARAMVDEVAGVSPGGR